MAISAATPVCWISSSSSWKTSAEVLRIEVAGRLVGQQQPGRVGERAGDRRALLLAARELRRPVIEPLAEPQHAEQLAGPLLGRRAAARRGSSAACTTFSSAENSGSSWWNW